MIIRLIFAAVILYALYRFVTLVQQKPQEQRRSYYLSLMIGLAAAGLVILSLTGRVHWIAGLIGGAIPFVRQYILNHVYHRLNQQTTAGNTNQGQQDSPRRQQNSQMSETEALAILGLQAGASEDDIVKAHRLLMQKLHPDRGGNDYLASQLNAAKETLLQR